MQLNRYSVLIVDDTREERFLLMAMLQKIKDTQFDVLQAENGRQALEMLQGQEVDLIVTDLSMPEMDGLSFIRVLRQQPPYAEIPIIFVTAYDDPENRLKAFDYGATDYVVKPYLIRELRARILGHLERRQSYQGLWQRQRQMEEELEEAREAQLLLLPKALPQIPGIELGRKYIPMQKIGGDFYDIFESKEHLGLMIGDVSGHGITAALLSFMIFSLFKDTISEHESPHEVLGRINDRLVNKMPRNKFATMFYASYHRPTRILSFASASHPSPLVVRPSTGEVFRLEARGLILGQFSNLITGYETQEFQLIPGDKLILYTDGLIEARNSQNKLLGVQRFIHLLRKYSHFPIQKLVEDLYQASLDFSGQLTFEDDISLVGLEVKAD